VFAYNEPATFMLAGLGFPSQLTAVTIDVFPVAYLFVLNFSAKVLCVSLHVWRLGSRYTD